MDTAIGLVQFGRGTFLKGTVIGTGALIDKTALKGECLLERAGALIGRWGATLNHNGKS